MRTLQEMTGTPKSRTSISVVRATGASNRDRHDGKDVKAGVTEKFLDQMFASDRRTGFYMGNFELAARRGKFSVLGVYWPKAEDAVAPQPALF